MKLTLTSSQFANLVVCFLYEQVTHPEESIPVALNPDWSDFVEVLNRKGMRTALLQYYLGMDPQIRIRWNMIKKTFMNISGSGPSYIEIQNEIVPKDKPSPIRQVGKFLKKVGYGLVTGAVGLTEEEQNDNRKNS